nr:LppA family lipoprotein [Nocardia bovistercoris]
MTRSLAAVLGAAILSACGGCVQDPYNTKPSAEEIAHAEERMRALPSVVDSEAQLAAVVREITDAAKTIAPELNWYTRSNREQSTLGCPSPYLETTGVSMTTDRFVSDTPIPETAWGEVLRIARDIAARNGMTTLTVRIDRPGDHDVVLHSPDDGNEIKFGTLKAAVIVGSTGCRFRAEDLPPTGK